MPHKSLDSAARVNSPKRRPSALACNLEPALVDSHAAAGWFQSISGPQGSNTEPVC